MAAPTMPGTPPNPASPDADPRAVCHEKAASLVRAAEQRLGRPIRMLHVGNIANNAYNNAAMMRALGIECDVLCIDYYHIMGTPEWEDAEVVGTVRDQFHPDWTSVDLTGFRRPEWFVQGPLWLALAYLEARHGGSARAADLWKSLGYFNRTRPARLADWPGHQARLAFHRAGRIGRLLLTPERPIRRLRDIGRSLRRRVEPRLSWNPVGSMLVRVTARMVDRATVCAVQVSVAVARLIHRAVWGGRMVDVDSAVQQELADEFRALFPDRADVPEEEDILLFANELPAWKRVLAHYDVVQGYGTDPIVLMLADAEYHAFEHGTLRELPFEPSPLGRLTALAFHRARHVFVSNSDCVDNARQLSGERVSVLPHPFDERRMERVTGVDALREELREALDADFLFFFPTRHDWVAGTGYADKANDRFLEAFCTLRAEGHRVGLVACEWGKNVPESRALLERFGGASSTRWLAPMCLRRYDRMMLACDVVVDQFLLGAFGGVTFRALAAGAPVCTYLDEAQVATAFGDCPPVLNASSREEILDVLRPAMTDRAALREVGDAARRWTWRHHSGIATVLTQLEVTLPGLGEQST